MLHVTQPCQCPNPCVLTLNEELVDLAMRGAYDHINCYLENGGNVNARGKDTGCTLLCAVCNKGQVRILEKLLNCYDLHVNLVALGSNPLTHAIDGLHFECVKMLLKSKLKCILNLDLSWDKLVRYVSFEPKLWFDLTVRVASQNDLEKLAEVLCIKNHLFVPSIKVVVAAIEGSTSAVTSLIENNSNIDKFLDGTLIAVSCYDVTERMAELFVGHAYEYCVESIEASMIISSMKNHLGILPILLKRCLPRISYGALSTAQEAALESGHKNAVRLLEKALSLKCEYLLSPQS